MQQIPFQESVDTSDFFLEDGSILISDQQTFPFWVVAYGKFGCAPQIALDTFALPA